MQNNIIPLNIEAGSSLSIIKVAELYTKIAEAYKDSESIEIDLGNVNDCDTAGIQLLCSLKKSCIRDNKNLIIRNISGAVEKALNIMCISSDTIS